MSDDRERIASLVEMLDEHNLDALTVRVGEATYEVVRRAPQAATVMAAPALAESERAAAPASVPPAASAKPTAAGNYKKVSAPIIGVFYRSSAPGAETFVEVGDRVDVGQVLCIIEAMKLMNEITSDHAGIVRRILPENGALVSLGEEMFWIEP